MTLTSIETPECQTYFCGKGVPAGWKDFKTIAYNVRRPNCTGFCDAEMAKDDQGRIRISWTEMAGGVGRYQIFSSSKAYDIACDVHSYRDPEGRGGRYFPSDYKRLKIDHPDSPSADSVTGRVHNPRCTCIGCGDLTPFYDVKFAWSDEDGYMPHCKDCYPF